MFMVLDLTSYNKTSFVDGFLYYQPGTKRRSNIIIYCDCNNDDKGCFIESIIYFEFSRFTNIANIQILTRIHYKISNPMFYP